MSTVAILGANGVYARHLIPRLVSAGMNVRALARRPEAALTANALNVSIVAADIFDTSTMVRALEGCDVAINLATSLPGPSGRGDFAANDQLRIEGVPIFLEACHTAGVKRIVQQSISFVNASGGSDWSDEHTVYRQPTVPTIASKAIAAALEMEASVEESDHDWLILRGGLFYGAGTGFDENWFARALDGRLRAPGDGIDYVSLVHISDMATATLSALERWPSREKLIVCDELPVQWGELFKYVAACVGKPEPPVGGPVGFPSFRLRNNRAKAALSWKPFYRTYREGLAR